MSFAQECEITLKIILAGFYNKQTVLNHLNNYLSKGLQKKKITVLKNIAIIGLVQAIFGIIIFISKRPRHLSFIFLCIWLGVIAVFQGARLLPFQVIDYFKPGIFPLLFLYGPLLYLYVSSLAVENFRLKKSQLLHLLPLIAISLHRSAVGPVPIGSSSNGAGSAPVFYNNLYYGLMVLSMLLYWFFSLKLILKHRKNIPNHFSNYTAKNSLGWLVSVLTLFLVLFIADFSLSLIDRVFGFELRRISLLSLNLTIFTFIIIFFGINQSAIYKPVIKNDKPETQPLPKCDENKNARPALTEQETAKLTNTVFQYLQTKKPYLNPDYSLQMMAEDLQISRHKLSYIINIGLQKNFYKLINEFRVQEVKEMLVNPEYHHYTLLGIGLECGFNSKTSFNRIFKEETGLTPTEYKKTI
ncbi:MAG: AraC family transcriptional regulator [Bacteroidetes bacterium]|nr:MAG: AraC family transcriptional regulator [Bacteroidota bacterium]